MLREAADMIEHLTSALTEIRNLADVRCDEAPSIAGRALVEIEQ